MQEERLKGREHSFAYTDRYGDDKKRKKESTIFAEMSVCQRVCERVILLTETHQTTCNK